MGSPKPVSGRNLKITPMSAAAQPLGSTPSANFSFLHKLVGALLILGMLALSPICSAYIPCSGAAGLQGSESPGGAFVGSGYQGAICNYESADLASQILQDTYWVEIENNSSSPLWCAVTLYILTEPSGEATVPGSAEVFPGETAIVAESDNNQNTGGVDPNNTISSVQCATSDAGGSSSGGGGSGPVASGSGGIELLAQSSYATSGDQVTLNVGEIDNTSSASTGTLRVELWLTSTPYSGGGITGYRVALYQLQGSSNGVLGPNQYFNPFSVTLNLTNMPGPGTYYAALLVTEYEPTSCSAVDGFCIVAYASTTNPFVISNNSGSVGSGNVVLTGPYSFSMDYANDTLQFDVSQIADTSATYVTNSLRLEWWLTASPYTGVSEPGYRIATWQITGSSNGELGPGQSFLDVTGNAALGNLPPTGTYYATMIVSEYTESCGSSDGYCTDTYGNFPNQVTIAAQLPPAPPQSGGTGSGGGSSGGGGSLDWLTLALLGVMAMLKSTRERLHRRLRVQSLVKIGSDQHEFRSRM